jgi:drug/metabolite transporter (DMT)-like permease
MLSSTGALVLFAAFLHASWNAMLHGHRDRFVSMTWIAMAMAAASTVVALFSPWPVAAAWPYIVASGLTHIAYNLCLVWAYRGTDLARAYPIARGSSPVLVTLGAALFARESIGPVHVLGVLLISGGIVSLALRGDRLSRPGLLAALATGATIAVYTVIDGIGIRVSDGRMLAYTPWMFMLNWLMPLPFIAMRGTAALWAPVRDEPRMVLSSCIGGLVSIAAYGIVIWAMQSGAMGTVSALRETSVVFAVLIGRLFLREKVGLAQWCSCLVVAAGAICLGL